MWRKIFYSFPVQLIINHLKKNQILLFFWFLLFAVVALDFARLIGIPYLFLDPEYQKNVNFQSLFIMGLAVGTFTMAFHITSYILDGERFSFLVDLRKPFFRFFLNNNIIPLFFLAVYLYRFVKFQVEVGLQSPEEIATEVNAFLIGYITVHVITFVYFYVTHKDIFKLMAANVNAKLRKNKIYRVNVLKHYDSFKKDNYRVDYFIDFPFILKKTNTYLPYDKGLIWQVFNQNHFNAVLLEIIALILLIILGLFRDNEFLQIPAGASILLLLALIVMFTGAFSYWLRGWAISSFLLLLLVINFFLSNNFLNGDYQAFGINYKTDKADYSLENLRKLSSDSNYVADFNNTKIILENWRKKFPKNEKPKMIFISTSGGGQRSAMWTMRTLQVVDSVLKGRLMKQAMLITGASGGLIGASYYRELYWQQQLDPAINRFHRQYLDNISADMLNSVAFTLIVNDIFLRMQRFKVGDYVYTKDRGYTFEQQLIKNTQSVLNKRLKDYEKTEQEALIPLMIMAPSIVNDGRKLYIASQPISYMTTVNVPSSSRYSSKIIKGVEFQRLFERQDASNLLLSSALRMSATFPYITPNIMLPSQPQMEIMDAGLSDNFGVRDVLRFLYVFRKWIEENTSGVIMVTIRDSGKEVVIEREEQRSVFTQLFNPIRTLYTNWSLLQDNNNDIQIEYAQSWFKGKLDVVNFQYNPKSTIDTVGYNALRDERASLSWHLTTLEKEGIRLAIGDESNCYGIERLQQLLNTNTTKSKK